MNWYETKPKKTNNFTELTKTYDIKYGDYDYSKDSRAKDATFERTLLAAMGNLAGKCVLVCGSNSGHEIRLLRKRYPAARFVAVDISLKALMKLPPEVSRVHASMDDLPFKDAAFDAYLSCRSIQSSGVDLKRAVSEAKRVTKGKIVVSVPNGYLVKGKIVNGLYNYKTKQIETRDSEGVAATLKKLLSAKKEVRSEAEIFLTANS